MIQSSNDEIQLNVTDDIVKLKLCRADLILNKKVFWKGVIDD